MHRTSLVISCLAPLLASVALAACVVAPRNDSGISGGASNGTGDSTDGVPGDDSGAAEGGNDASAGTAPGGDGNGPKLDVGHAGEGGAGTCDADDPDCHCSAVDVLFIIDNSGSMIAHQAALAEVFPYFVDVMVERLPVGTDLHVGITTQGGFWTGAGTGSWPNFMCVTDADPYPGGFTPPSEGHNGTNGDQGRLYEHDGLRYFSIVTGEEAPDELSEWFSTAATLPDADSPQVDQVELLSAAAAYPFHPANAEYNAGFLRDKGAVLLLFFLTDTSDITPESASSLADIVRAAKAGCGGDMCILTGGMIDPESPCEAEYPRLDEFMGAFGKPPTSVGDITAGGGGGWPPPAAPIEVYEMVLGDALAEAVAQTCETIAPEG